jgi:23S rRNA pseudouridine1911/1915/1917 synthase
MSQSFDHRTHTVDRSEQGTRLDVLLSNLGFVTSRSLAARLIEEGSVQVDGSPTAKRYAVREGDRIDLELPLTTDFEPLPEDIPLDIRYEDEHLIVLSKQAGLVVHPAQGHRSGTLVNALLHHAETLGALQGEERPGIVHRLDKDTTGLMLVAKTDDVQFALQEGIKVRSIDRRYLTLVHGWIAPESGIVDAPLSRDTRDRLRMSVSDRPEAKQAVTTFSVLERFEAGIADDGFTLTECKLYTGRTHQIRVHMAYIRHPVVGDQLYGARRIRADHGLERQFLHSYRLAFTHPVTGDELEFLDPLPADLSSVIDILASLSTGPTAYGESVSALLDSIGDCSRSR